MTFRHIAINVKPLNSNVIRIAIWTAVAIIAVQFLSTLVVYNFFRFDIYLSIIAAAFLIAGYLLASHKPAVIVTLSTKETTNDSTNILTTLTNREITIFSLISQGKTNKEIADTLSVELSTVKTHINNLYSKSGCNNRKEARQKWLELNQNGLIS